MADIIVEWDGRRYTVNDPEVADHIRYLVEHTDLLRLRSMRAYELVITRTTDGTSYVPTNRSLPYTRRARDARERGA